MKRILCYLVIIAAVLLSFSTSAAAQEDKSIAPVKNNGKKWRMAYYQGGPYIDYQTILKAVMTGFMNIGWIEKTAYPKSEDSAETTKLWAWMTKNLKSDYIELVPDAYYDANWKKELRPITKSTAIERLNKKDIDLMLAFGTWAGLDLANNEHSVPTEVISASDPLGAGIVKGVETSGYDHIHAKIELRRYERQVQLFHDIIGFEKLGVVYENTDEGKTYAAIKQIESVAAERGFEIIRCFAPFSGIPDADAEKKVLACHNELAPQIGALYITTHRGVSLKAMPKLLAPLNKNKIPTFSQSGSKEVQHGVLLSIAQAGYKYAGEFHAKTIAKVFNGSKPGELSQIFESPPKIAINLKAAEIVGYDPPIDILGVADEIYQEIDVAQ
ncbi:MAG: ABC transporter substrate-binding protein [SAR324 cluster bacterium]|nr:ABC transporter substrate-binding protein [SAR324 cluster bacterium]